MVNYGTHGYVEKWTTLTVGEDKWYLSHHPPLNPKEPESFRAVFYSAANEANPRCALGGRDR